MIFLRRSANKMHPFLLVRNLQIFRVNHSVSHHASREPDVGRYGSDRRTKVLDPQVRPLRGRKHGVHDPALRSRHEQMVPRRKIANQEIVCRLIRVLRPDSGVDHLDSDVIKTDGLRVFRRVSASTERPETVIEHRSHVADQMVSSKFLHEEWRLERIDQIHRGRVRHHRRSPGGLSERVGPISCVGHRNYVGWLVIAREPTAEHGSLDRPSAAIASSNTIRSDLDRKRLAIGQVERFGEPPRERLRVHRLESGVGPYSSDLGSAGIPDPILSDLPREIGPPAAKSDWNVRSRDLMSPDFQRYADESACAAIAQVGSRRRTSRSSRDHEPDAVDEDRHTSTVPETVRTDFSRTQGSRRDRPRAGQENRSLGSVDAYHKNFSSLDPTIETTGT